MTKGTVEERIVKRAQQKQNVQATVYSGGAFKADIFKPQDVSFFKEKNLLIFHRLLNFCLMKAKLMQMKPKSSWQRLAPGKKLKEKPKKVCI